MAFTRWVVVLMMFGVSQPDGAGSSSLRPPGPLPPTCRRVSGHGGLARVELVRAAELVRRILAPLDRPHAEGVGTQPVSAEALSTENLQELVLQGAPSI